MLLMSYVPMVNASLAGQGPRGRGWGGAEWPSGRTERRASRHVVVDRDESWNRQGWTVSGRREWSACLQHGDGTPRLSW